LLCWQQPQLRKLSRRKKFTNCKSGAEKAPRRCLKPTFKADRKGLEIFENNYNVRLNKCFLLEENTMIAREQGKTISSKLLHIIDVNANKVVGSFSPLNCDVQDKQCRNEQEFRALIKPFMEE